MNRLMAVLRPAALLAFEVGLSGERKVADTLATIEKDTALLGSNGRVLYMSRGFERHLGDAFALKSGKLTSWDERTSRILAASIDRAIGRGDVSERVSPRFSIPRRNGRPLLANVIPAVGAAHDILALTRAFLVVADAERLNDEPAAMVSAALRLSPAEGRLAVKIAQGESLKSIAESEQVTLETARKRLKAIFAKTGTHRQTELAILIGKLTSVG
jgi:DNA-binding CsgD family transcriptional regulator